MVRNTPPPGRLAARGVLPNHVRGLDRRVRAGLGAVGESAPAWHARHPDSVLGAPRHGLRRLADFDVVAEAGIPSCTYASGILAGRAGVGSPCAGLDVTASAHVFDRRPGAIEAVRVLDWVWITTHERLSNLVLEVP